MQADRTKIWDSVGLQERFTELVGSSIRRADLLKMLSRDVDDIVILSAPGYRKVVMFCDNARATLKVTKDDADEDDITQLLFKSLWVCRCTERRSSSTCMIIM